MTSLLILLGVALSSLIVSSCDIKPQPGFKMHQLKGKWYYIGIASDHPWVEERTLNLHMGFCILDPSRNGDVAIAMEISRPEGKCESFITQGKKGHAHGVYTYKIWGSRITITIHEIKEDEYAFVHAKIVHGKDVGIVTKLIARKREVCDAVKEKWLKWTESLGVSDENTIFLEKGGGCID